jgi:hypothetical protein
VLHSFVTKTINRLTDWLIAFLGIALILWFGFTLPSFSLSKTNEKAASLNFDHIKQSDLKNHVEVLSNYYAPRTIEFGNLNATASYIHTEFAKYGDAQYQPYWTLISRYKNVILELGPDTEETLVIGAHYDAKNDSLDIDGNASGVAALIELAHQLSINEDKLSIGVQLVAYPLSQKKSVTIENMGSYHHARLLHDSGKSVKLMLSLDGVGSFTDEKESQKYPYEFLHHVYPDKGNYISLVGRLQDYSEIMALKNSFKQASRLPLYSFSLPESYYPTSSQDHLNYQRHGYPAMVITDTSEYRAIEISKKSVAERLDYEKIALLVQGLYQVVMDNESKLLPQDVELVQSSSDSDFSSIIDEIQ